MGHLLSINPEFVVGAIIILGVAVWRRLSRPSQAAVSILCQQRERTDDGLLAPSRRESPVPRKAANQQPVRGSAATPGNAQAHDSALSGALAPISVLLVEDDDDSRQMLTNTLQYYGARVVAVSSASEALQMLDTHHVDVLLSDLRLPEKDGLALIHELRLRTDPAVALMPAASITASRLTEDRRHALAAGYQVHMEKPVDPDDLVSTVLTLAATPRANDRITH